MRAAKTPSLHPVPSPLNYLHLLRPKLLIPRRPSPQESSIGVRNPCIYTPIPGPNKPPRPKLLVPRTKITLVLVREVMPPLQSQHIPRPTQRGAQLLIAPRAQRKHLVHREPALSLRTLMPRISRQGARLLIAPKTTPKHLAHLLVWLARGRRHYLNNLKSWLVPQRVQRQDQAIALSRQGQPKIFQTIIRLALLSPLLALLALLNSTLFYNQP